MKRWKSLITQPFFTRGAYVARVSGLAGTDCLLSFDCFLQELADRAQGSFPRRGHRRQLPPVRCHPSPLSRPERRRPSHPPRQLATRKPSAHHALSAGTSATSRRRSQRSVRDLSSENRHPPITAVPSPFSVSIVSTHWTRPSAGVLEKTESPDWPTGQVTYTST